MLRLLLGMGAKARNVPLTRPAAEAIEAYLLDGRPKIRGATKSPWLFLALRGGRMYPDLLNGVVQAAAKKTGLEKDATCHTLRHSGRRSASVSASGSTSRTSTSRAPSS